MSFNPTWDEIISEIDRDEYLSDYEKEQTIRAIRKLRCELGEEFFNITDESNEIANYHPIHQYFINTAPWTRKWLTNLASSLDNLKEEENYMTLIKRIKSPSCFPEGYSVLETAHKFFKSGFNITFDEQVNINGKHKKPDIKLRNSKTEEELYVEVSIQGASDTERESNKTWNGITDLFYVNIHSIEYRGQIKKVLSTRHLLEVRERLESLIKKVIKENCFQELIDEGVLEIGIAPKGDTKILDLWAEKRGIGDFGFAGPRIEFNELSRTKSKIRREQEQLPINYPNIITIKNSRMFNLVNDPEKTIHELEECVYDFPQVLAVIVYDDLYRYENEEAIIIPKDNSFFLKNNSDYLMSGNLFFAFNKFCEVKITPLTINKIYSALNRY